MKLTPDTLWIYAGVWIALCGAVGGLFFVWLFGG
jgi:hypothetical protein